VFASLGAAVIAIEPLPENVRVLHNGRYRNKITVVQTAVGAQVGTGKIRIATLHTMASMSAEWIRASGNSPRLRGFEWGWLGEMEVPVTTLDALCHTYGLPDFIKIDVEGYEEMALDGLSFQPECLSFEFNPEILHVAQRCLEKPVFHAGSKCNYFIGGPSKFVLDHWTTGEVVMQCILDSRPSSGGDIFVKRPLC
jgi:FkbM family methyltransferase